MILREYQTRALDESRASLARQLAALQKPSLLLCAPTGAGKTSIAAEMIRGATARGFDTLFLAHRQELIEQCSERLDSIGVDHGIIQADHPRALPGLPVQVASVQTLARRDLPRAPRLIIIDEAHRARAGGYQKIIERFPGAAVVGLTATPMRLDGKGLGNLFNDLVVVTSPRSLIEQGFLVPYTGFAYDSPALKDVKKKGGDYDAAGLQLVVGGSKLVGNIVEQWQQHANGRRTVVFAVNRAHSHDLVERFRAVGVNAAHVGDDTSSGDRRAILKDLRSGKMTVLSNVAIVTEGFDLPTLECCILARPTLSLTLFLQQVGRVLRPACRGCGSFCDPRAERCACGSTDIKRLARIHDHAGCFMQHGAPDADRTWALEYDVAKRKTMRPPALRTCSYCLRVFDPAEGDACPSCGQVNQPSKREIAEITKDVTAIPLSELPRFKEASAAEKAAWLAAQEKVASEKGYAQGWARHRFKAVFGTWPPRRAA